ncbi:MAG: hypothetical protein ACHQFW_01945 [Chitinophagales bacterium]
MMKLMELIVLIIISIIKRMNTTLNTMVELMENTYELMVTTKTKTTEKIIRVMVVLVTGKMIESIAGNKMITVIEIIKIMEKYVSITGIVEVTVMWMIMVLLMIENTVKGENGMMGVITFTIVNNNMMVTEIAVIEITIIIITSLERTHVRFYDKLRSNGQVHVPAVGNMFTTGTSFYY